MTEAFRLYCEYSLCFDLEGFDRWLDELGDCGAKRELTERREKAYRAFLTRANEHGKIQMNLDDDSADDIKGHLEWCLLRWRGIQTAVVVGPIARIGANVKKARAGKRQRFSARLVVAELKKELHLVSADQLVQEWRAGLPRVGEHEIDCEEIDGRFIARANNPNSPFYDRKIDVLESTIRDAFVR